MIKKVNEILEFKELLINLTKKNLKLKYKNSVLGFFWSFLNPLMMMIVYTFAFKYVLKIKIPNFTVFLLAGLLPWTFFQSSIQESTNSIVNNAALIKKVYFPKEIIPISGILSNFINFFITLIVVFVAIIFFKIKIGLSIIVLPLILLLLLLFTIGLSLLLSSLNVLYRDISHFVEIIFMAWFYVTPIVYSMDLIPQKFKIILLANPMTLIVESIRATLLYNTMPKIKYLLIIMLVDFMFVLVGYKVFDNMQKSFAEEI